LFVPTNGLCVEHTRSEALCANRRLVHFGKGQSITRESWDQYKHATQQHSSIPTDRRVNANK